VFTCGRGVQNDTAVADGHRHKKAQKDGRTQEDRKEPEVQRPQGATVNKTEGGYCDTYTLLSMQQMQADNGGGQCNGMMGLSSESQVGGRAVRAPPFGILKARDLMGERANTNTAHCTQHCTLHCTLLS